MQESVRGPDFTRGWALSLPGSPPSPSLWECGNPCLMRVSKRRGRSRLGLSTVDPARHFHSELTDSAHFGEKRRSGTPQDQKRHFPKSRVECTFLQIVVQSPILRAAFLNVEIVNLPTGCCDAFSTSFARGTSECRGQCIDRNREYRSVSAQLFESRMTARNGRGVCGISCVSQNRQLRPPQTLAVATDLQFMGCRF